MKLNYRYINSSWTYGAEWWRLYLRSNGDVTFKDMTLCGLDCTLCNVIQRKRPTQLCVRSSILESWDTFSAIADDSAFTFSRFLCDGTKTINSPDARSLLRFTTLTSWFWEQPARNLTSEEAEYLIFSSMHVHGKPVIFCVVTSVWWPFEITLTDTIEESNQNANSNKLSFIIAH